MQPPNLVPQWRVYGSADLQAPYDVAVVMPTVGRSVIIDAVESVFLQRAGRIQLLIGVDRPAGDLDFLDAFLGGCPPQVTVHLVYPGYSTSVRHGGVTPARDGGALRAALTILANSRYVAYLDDDNWWGEDHLRDLLSAVEHRAWAYSLRYFVHPESRKPVCIDEWESVGPGRGVFREKFGGFVDRNCLLIDKVACWPAVGLWTVPFAGDAKGMSADCNVFHFLKNHSEPGATGKPTAFYALDPVDGRHASRLRVMGRRYEEAS